MSDISILRPGIMVQLRTSCTGNVHYTREDIVVGDERSEWNTTRTVADAAEFKLAKQTVSKARNTIARLCTNSKFALLCAKRDADLLTAAINEARAMCDKFNATALYTNIRVYCMRGEVAADDLEAVKAIQSEIREYLDAMTAGIAKMDVQAIRDAAASAKDVSNALEAKAQASVQIAVDEARKIATQINKAVKAGEQASIEIDQLSVRKIMEQRTAFLDFSEPVEIEAPVTEARAIDFAPVEEKANAV